MTLMQNLLNSLARPIVEAYNAGDTDKAKALLHNKIAEHNSPYLGYQLTRTVQEQLTNNKPNK